MNVILYADDEPDDVFFMRRAFEQAGIEQPLHTVHDGSEAIAYLSGQGQYTDRKLYPLPSLILLDLNMPRSSGFDVLNWIRATPALAALPVLVMSSSGQECDIKCASLLGANGYLVKPGKPEDLLGIVTALKDQWLASACLGDKADVSIADSPSRRHITIFKSPDN